MVSLGLSFGGTQVTVVESGVSTPGGPPLLTVTVQGAGVADIPIRILPLPYSAFSKSLLDELYPTRPINAATGNNNVCIVSFASIFFAIKQKKTSIPLSSSC